MAHRITESLANGQESQSQQFELSRGPWTLTISSSASDQLEVEGSMCSKATVGMKRKCTEEISIASSGDPSDSEKSADSNGEEKNTDESFGDVNRSEGGVALETPLLRTIANSIITHEALSSSSDAAPSGGSSETNVRETHTMGQFCDSDLNTSVTHSEVSTTLQSHPSQRASKRRGTGGNVASPSRRRAASAATSEPKITVVAMVVEEQRSRRKSKKRAEQDEEEENLADDGDENMDDDEEEDDDDDAGYSPTRRAGAAAASASGAKRARTSAASSATGSRGKTGASNKVTKSRGKTAGPAATTGGRKKGGYSASSSSSSTPQSSAASSPALMGASGLMHPPNAELLTLPGGANTAVSAPSRGSKSSKNARSLGAEEASGNNDSLLWDVLAMEGLRGKTDVAPPCAYECLRQKQMNPSYFVVGTVMLPDGTAYNFPVVQEALTGFRTDDLEVTGIHSSLYNEKKTTSTKTGGGGRKAGAKKKSKDEDDDDDDGMFDDEVYINRSNSVNSVASDLSSVPTPSLNGGKKIGQLFVKVNVFGPHGKQRGGDAVTVTFHRKNSIKIAGLKGGDEKFARERSALVISSLCNRIQQRFNTKRDVLEIERGSSNPASWTFELKQISIRQWASFPGLFAGNSNFKSIFVDMADGQIGRVEENSNKALRCKTSDGTLQIQRTGLMQVLASVEEPARFASRFCWVLYQMHLSERVFPDIAEEDETSYADYDAVLAAHRDSSSDEAHRLTSDEDPEEEEEEEGSTITRIMPARKRIGAPIKTTLSSLLLAAELPHCVAAH